MNVDALLNPEALAANLDGDNALFELHRADGPGHGAGGEEAEGPGHGAGGQPFPPQLMNVLPDPQAPMDALFNPEAIAAMAAYLNEDNAQFQQHLDGLNH